MVEAVTAARVRPPRLEMKGVSKRFAATVALDNVDLTVHAGQVHALVGENGAGKSTLMKVLSGSVHPDAGQMRLDGQPFRPVNPLQARRAGVAMIYQELSLAPHLSVEENIMLGMEPTRLGLIDRKQVRRKATEALSQLGHPEIDPRALVGRLSVALQQLVEIARAVAVGSRVLILDEPTSSLSADDTKRLFELIGRLKQRGHAVVYISHFIEEVKQVADRFTVLRDGRTVGSGETRDTSVDQIVGMMIGRQIDQLYPRSQRTPGPVVLEVSHLAGSIKPFSASFTLRRNEVLGIAGLVGAGRTELLRAIFGLDAVRKGRIRVGAYFGPASPARRWAQSVGLLCEDRKEQALALSMSLADNLTLSKLPAIVRPARQAADCQRWIDELAIRCTGPQQAAAELSGGNQQKLALARLLHHDVDVLLLDEPTRGIDVASKAQIYQLIDQLVSGQRGKAVLMVSSYLPELLGICDRVAVMHRGRLGPARNAEELSEHQLMLLATGGEQAS